MFLERAWPVTGTGITLKKNSLPEYLRQIHNITLFQQKLKTHLFLLTSQHLDKTHERTPQSKGQPHERLQGGVRLVKNKIISYMTD